MIPTSDESLMMPTKLLAMGGMMILHACGQITFANARVLLSPVERSASLCPLSIACRPDRYISAPHAPYCKVRQITPDQNASILSPVTRDTPYSIHTMNTSGGMSRKIEMYR